MTAFEARPAPDTDSIIAMIESLVGTLPESMVQGLTEAQVAEEHLVLVRFLGDALRGPIRTAIRSASPDRAEQFEQSLDRLKTWTQNVEILLGERLELLHSSDRILAENDSAYRKLAG